MDKKEHKTDATSEHEHILESLNANERKILQHLNEPFEHIIKKSGLDEVAVLRSLEFLSNKKILELKIKSSKIIDLGVNGILYKQKGLPERRLINILRNKRGNIKKKS